MALETPVRRSPLAHRVPIDAEGEAIRMAERPFLGKFILRASHPEAAGVIRDTFGIELPSEPLSTVTGRGMSLIWLGPDEWMLVTPPEEAEERGGRAERALSAIRHQLVAVGDYYTVIEVSGPKAREALMKLTTLDLHPRAFRAGMAAGSIFGRAQSTLWLVADEPADGPLFRLFVRWSMADYLWCVIASAGREWGMPEQQPIGGETLTIPD